MKVTDIYMKKEPDGKHDIPNLNSESGLLTEKVKSKTQYIKGDSKKSGICIKHAPKSTPGIVKMKYTVPQPFALATERRAQSVTRPTGTETDAVTPGRKSYHFTSNLNTQPSLKQTEVKISTCLANYSVLNASTNQFPTSYLLTASLTLTTTEAIATLL